MYSADIPLNFINFLASTIEYLNNTLTFKEENIKPDMMGLVKKGIKLVLMNMVSTLI